MRGTIDAPSDKVQPERLLWCSHERQSGPIVSSDAAARDRAVGLTIRVLRTERRIDRKTLARLTRLSYPYLSEIEAGRKHPSTRVLAQIAEALEVGLAELIAGAESRMGATAPRRVAASSMPASPAHDRLESPLAQEPPDELSQAGPGWFGDRTLTTDLSASVVPSADRSDSREDLVWELNEAARSLEAEDVRRLIDLARRLGDR